MSIFEGENNRLILTSTYLNTDSKTSTQQQLDLGKDGTADLIN